MRRHRGKFLSSIAAAALCLGACAVPAASSNPAGGTSLWQKLAAIENQGRYGQSDWGYTVLDEATGQRLIAQNDWKLFDPGSTMKTFSVSDALDSYSTDYRFHTPVYRQGSVVGATLRGNLVLVGSGDMSMGLREQPNGTLYYENLPALDHSYANVGLPGAVEPPGDPLTALNELARKVRASGITRVTGNVVIDDRLFTPFNGFPDGLISPIWVNENLIDVLVKPTAVGRPATIDWRPMTASYTLDNQVTTVSADKATPLQVSEPTPGRLVVTGKIAVNATPTLVVREIDDPSAFARTAFIEALQRAGVTVTTDPTGPNPESLLPPANSYRPADKLGEHVSATLAQFANLIMKVSYNRGADLMSCLSAVAHGSTDCEDGVASEVPLAERLGVPATSFYPFDGAGSDDRGRVTPQALATFYRNAPSTSFGSALFDALPVLGRSGTLANVLQNSPAAGHAQLKTGNRAVGTPADQLLLLGNTLAGYVQAKSGRRLTVMIAVGNVPLADLASFAAITLDQARMVEAIQQAY